MLYDCTLIEKKNEKKKKKVVRQLVYTMFITNNQASLHLW